MSPRALYKLESKCMITYVLINMKTASGAGIRA